MNILDRALSMIRKPSAEAGGTSRSLPSGVKAFFDMVQPMTGPPVEKKPEMVSYLNRAPAGVPHDPNTVSMLPSEKMNTNYETRIDQLQNIANYVGRPDSPVAREFPGLIQIEKESNIPGLARTLAALSQVESNMGESSAYDPNLNNPFGLLSAGHGTQSMSFPSILDAARYVAGMFTDPNFVYQVQPGSPLTLDLIQSQIAPHYNIEGGEYWDLFKNLYLQGM